MATRQQIANGIAGLVNRRSISTRVGEPFGEYEEAPKEDEEESGLLRPEGATVEVAADTKALTGALHAPCMLQNLHVFARCLRCLVRSAVPARGRKLACKRETMARTSQLDFQGKLQ